MLTFTTYTQKEFQPGKYMAVIDSAVQDEGKFGTQLKLTFIVLIPETNENVTIMEWVKPQISTKYPLFSDLLTLLGIVGEEGEFDETKLVGRDCIVDTQLKPGKDGMNYLRVIRVTKK